MAVPTDQIRGNNIMLQSKTYLVDTEEYEALSMLEATTRASARAVIASVYTYDAADDHYMASFGRDNGHQRVGWSNYPYTQNTRYNDLMLTHEGQGGGMSYRKGHWHGSQVIPLSSSQTFKVQQGMGKSDSTNTAYTVVQQYAFLDDIAGFVDTPSNIRLTLTASGTKSVGLQPPSTVPATATAIIVSIDTYDDKRADHMVHSFGRHASHDTNIWRNRPAELNTYLNDVYVTHEGDASTGYYYGHSHGTSIIPLKSDGRFDAFLGLGYNTGSTSRAYVTLQVYGYINPLGSGGNTAPAVVVDDNIASGSFTASAFFHRPAAGLSAPFGVASHCRATDRSVCAWEIESAADGTSLRARISFAGASAARGADDWDFVVPTTAGDWHHAALVFDGATRLARLYVDNTQYLAPLGSDDGDVLATEGLELLYGTSGAGELHDLRYYDYGVDAGAVGAMWQGYAEMRRSTDVLMWWRLTAASGAFVRDAARRGLHGALIGAAATPKWAANGAAGPFSAAMYALTAGAVGLVGDAAFTLTAWVRTDALVGGRQLFLASTAGETAGMLGLGLSDGRPAVHFGHSGLAVRAASAADAITVGVWHQVVATRTSDGGGGGGGGGGSGKLATTALYLDGVPLATELHGAAGLATRDAAPALTDAAWVVGQAWNGQLQDVRVYARALTPAQVAAEVWADALVTRWALRLQDPSSSSSGGDGASQSGGWVPDVSPGAAYGTSHTSARATAAGDEGLVRTGGEDFVQSATPVALDGDRAFTVCAWGFATSSGWGGGGGASTVHVLAGLGAPTADLAHGTMLAVGVQGGAPVVDFGDGVTLTAADATTGSSSVATQRWFHMCATRVPGDKRRATALYLDGEPVVLAPPASSSSSSSSSGGGGGGDWDDAPLSLPADAVLRMGAGPPGQRQAGSQTLTGYIDDLRLYRRALGAAQVEALYLAGVEEHVRDLALRCTGTGHHVERAAATPTGGALTLELWLKAGQPEGAAQGVLDVGHSVVTSRFALWLEAGTGRMTYMVDNTNAGMGTTGGGSVQTAVGFPAGLWVHVVVSHAEDGAVHMYWNGQLQAVGADVPVPTSLPRSQLLLGRLMSSALVETFVGTLDDVAIWDGARTPAELAAATAAGDKPGATQVWYDFEQALTRLDPRVRSELDLVDASVLDRSVHGLHARLVCDGVCLTRAPVRAAVCGDGYKEVPEACDDGNSRGGDGCSATCGVEAGYVCLTSGVYEASVCERATVQSEQAFEPGTSRGLLDGDAATGAAGGSGSSSSSSSSSSSGGDAGGDGGDDGLEWEFVLHNPGDVRTQPSAYDHCTQWDDLGSNWVMRVQMGRVVDYYRPKGEVTLCSVLKATSTGTKTYMWAASPFGDFVTPPMYSTHLGGSASGWPSDGRVYTSFWGSQLSYNGGCCHYVNEQTRVGAEAQDTGAWGRAFTVSVARDRTSAWHAVMETNGAAPIYPSHYTSGTFPSGSTGHASCHDFDHYGSNFMFRVEMGDVVDFFRPSTLGHTFCDVVTSYSRHMWSSNEGGPFLTPPRYSNHLGGCQSGWPTSDDAAARGVTNDGRNYISFWGEAQGASHAGGCCFDGALDDNGVVSGNTWGLPFKMSVRRTQPRLHCNTVLDGGGWALVRHVPAGAGAWHPSNDQAAGTNTPYGVYQPDPQLAEYPFSVRYASREYTELLFATGLGNRFVIASRADVAKEGGYPTTVTVLRSHKRDTPTDVGWAMRPGQPEDPWISADSHAAAGESDAHSMVYGEASYAGWGYHRSHYAGANVYVRDFDECPAGAWMVQRPYRGAVEVRGAARALGRGGLRLRVDNAPYMAAAGVAASAYWAHATALLSQDAGPNLYLRLLGRVREAVGATSTPLVVTVQPDWVIARRADGPLGCEPACEWHYYRFCVNPGADVAPFCDETLAWEPNAWVALRAHVRAKWQSKYPGEEPPAVLGIQVAAYAKDGVAEAWVDDVTAFESDEAPPVACPAVEVRSGRGDPSTAKTCLAHKQYNPSAGSGVYTINPTGGHAFQVYCHMDGYDEAAWVVFQRRRDASVSFARGWADYKAGFGSLANAVTGAGDTNLWLGLAKMHEFTAAIPSKSWFHLYSRYDGTDTNWRYNHFKVEPESDKYRLRLSSAVTGSYGWDYHADNQFNTKDSSSPSCSNSYNGGWWYGGCHYMNYNGWWGNGPTPGYYADYINDYPTKGYYFSYSNVEMMFMETGNPDYTADFDELDLKVDGVQYATSASGLQVVHKPAAADADSTAVSHTVHSLAGDGSSFKAVVDAAAVGDTIAAGIMGRVTAGPLAEAWVTALADVGVDAPAVSAAMKWAFVGHKGAAVGTAQSSLGRDFDTVDVTVATTFACPAAPRLAIPENRVNPQVPVPLRADVAASLDAAGDVVLRGQQREVQLVDLALRHRENVLKAVGNPRERLLVGDHHPVAALRGDREDAGGKRVGRDLLNQRGIDLLLDLGLVRCLRFDVLLDPPEQQLAPLRRARSLRDLVGGGLRELLVVRALQLVAVAKELGLDVRLAGKHRVVADVGLGRQGVAEGALDGLTVGVGVDVVDQRPDTESFYADGHAHLLQLQLFATADVDAGERHGPLLAQPGLWLFLGAAGVLRRDGARVLTAAGRPAPATARARAARAACVRAPVVAAARVRHRPAAARPAAAGVAAVGCAGV